MFFHEAVSQTVAGSVVSGNLAGVGRSASKEASSHGCCPLYGLISSPHGLSTGASHERVTSLPQSKQVSK